MSEQPARYTADDLLMAYELGARAMAEHDARALSTGRRLRHAARHARMREMEVAADYWHHRNLGRPYQPYRGGPVSWEPSPIGETVDPAHLGTDRAGPVRADAHRQPDQDQPERGHALPSSADRHSRRSARHP